MLAVVIPPGWVDVVEKVRQLHGVIDRFCQALAAAPTVDPKGTGVGEYHEEGGEGRGDQIHRALWNPSVYGVLDG